MRDPSLRTIAWPALLCLGGAAALTWAGVTRHPALHVPPAVAYLTAGLFGCAALALLARAIRRPRAVAWLGVLLLAGGAALCAWIALDRGPNACRAAVAGVAIGTAAVGCRAAFGFAALVSAALALWAARLARPIAQPSRPAAQ